MASGQASLQASHHTRDWDRKERQMYLYVLHWKLPSNCSLVHLYKKKFKVFLVGLKHKLPKNWLVGWSYGCALNSMSSQFKENSGRLNTLSLEAQKFAKLGWLMDQVCICHCQLLLFIGNISFYSEFSCIKRLLCWGRGFESFLGLYFLNEM